MVYLIFLFFAGVTEYMEKSGEKDDGGWGLLVVRREFNQNRFLKLWSNASLCDSSHLTCI